MSDIENPEQYLTNVAKIIVFFTAIVFFFFGAIEFEDGRIYMPWFWSLGSILMSEPYSLFSVTHAPLAVW